MEAGKLKDLLEKNVEKYNQPAFLENDPLGIPHLFSAKQDIEIMGFWAAMLAWGQRKTILSKCRQLIALTDNAPYDFMRNHQESDLKPFLTFKHRTFNADDTLYFLAFFKDFYTRNESLETAFSRFLTPADETTEKALNGFQQLFFSLPDFPPRTRKHVSAPSMGSACKRLNMFLRWMVRKDDKGVDFGIWQHISPSQLVCPCDVHVDRIARKLGLITRKQTDWKTALELTTHLRQFDPADPVKYDFALFGLGLEKY